MDKEAALREKTIVKTSIIGMIANVFLAGFKAVIGLMTNSIAIVLDAVNNISDAGSSLITIIGTKLAGREPDKKHPFGYGRIEYLSAMIISLINSFIYMILLSFTAGHIAAHQFSAGLRECFRRFCLYRPSGQFFQRLAQLAELKPVCVQHLSSAAGTLLPAFSVLGIPCQRMASFCEMNPNLMCPSGDKLSFHECEPVSNTDGTDAGL